MTEAQEQREIVRWFRAKWPEHSQSLRVSQTGGYRGKGRAGAIRQAQIKGQGGVVGEADIAILLPRGGFGALLIEHKGEGQAHGLTEAQAAYLEYHRSIGNAAAVTRGIDAAKAAIESYMAKK